MVNIVFIGAPGSGKGTQSALLAEKLGIPNISTGDILRKEVANKSNVGELAKSYMDSGRLVPDHVMVDIIKKRIADSDCDDGFILDGFPRNSDQAVSLDLMLEGFQKKINIVINIDIDDDVLIKRIAGRFSCVKCGSVYNHFFKNLKSENACDKCSSDEFSSRSDDNESTVRKRLEIYNQNTEGLINLYIKKDLIYSVDGLKNIALISSEINEAINKVILNISN
jgi:adenylate kinase